MSLESFEARADARTTRLSEEKSRIDEKARKTLDDQREKFDVEIKKERVEYEKKLDEKRARVAEIRQNQKKSLQDLEDKIAELNQEAANFRADRGRENVEKSIEDLNALRKTYEAKARLLRDQIDESTNLLAIAELKRQEGLDELEKQSLEQKAEFQRKALESDQIAHETRVNGVKILEGMDAKRSEKHKETVLKRSDRVVNNLLIAEQLQSSLAIEDAFREFETRSRRLCTIHSKFTSKYVQIEPSLLRSHTCMLKGRKFDDFDMEPLQDALLRFKEQADGFNAAGSTREEEFQKMAGTLRDLIETLTTEFNGISAKIEDFEAPQDSQQVDPKETGIIEAINGAKKTMAEISTLMQGFNVIGRDHFQETLRIQMAQVQTPSAANRAAIQGPPAYEKSTKKAIQDV